MVNPIYVPSENIYIVSAYNNTVALFVMPDPDIAFGPMITNQKGNAANVAVNFIEYINKRLHKSFITIPSSTLAAYYNDFKKEAYHEA